MLQYKYSIVLYVTKLGGSYLKAIDNWLSDLVEEPAF